MDAIMIYFVQVFMKAGQAEKSKVDVLQAVLVKILEGDLAFDWQLPSTTIELQLANEKLLMISLESCMRRCSASERTFTKQLAMDEGESDRALEPES
eukprot:2616519-Lingulodinium_polyedra.AAC.1